MAAPDVTTIERLAAAKVLCAGDVMLDHFIYGEVERVSPEAPIPVLRIARHQSMLGGAGNVVRNVRSLGGSVRFVSVVGDDPAGTEVQALCEATLTVEPGRITPSKSRYVAQGQQLLRADSESTAPITDASFSDLRSRFQDALSDCNVVLLSDYAKGVLSGDRAQALIESATAAGRPVVVDPKGADFRRYRGATLVKPNLKELAIASGLPVDSDLAVEHAARHILNGCDIRFLLVTRGAKGMMLVPESGVAVMYPAMAREVFDVSGAGDTVAAVLALGLGAGLAVAEAAEIANIAAGIAVGKAGTATVHASEIVAALQSLPGAFKAASTLDAARLAAEWKSEGLHVGFVHGAFTTLDAAQVGLLQDARRRCDRLIVGLDAGPDLASRATVVSALGCVDLVVLNDRRALFLDRDGVVNEDTEYLSRPEDVRWVEGAPELIAKANALGYAVIVITNQSGVARGWFAEEDVQSLHAWMAAQLEAKGARVDAFYYCPHHPEAPLEEYRKDCECRKPKPGLFLQAIREWNIDPAQSLAVGDKDRDLQAASAAGVPSLHKFPGGNLLDFLSPHLDA